MTNEQAVQEFVDKRPTDVKDLAVCLSLSFGRFQITKKVRVEKVEVDADKEMIGVHKKILDSNAYKAITSLDSTISNYVKARALPSLLRRGIYLLPVAMVQDIEGAIEEFRIQRDTLIEEFLADYDREILSARERLASLYNEQDYPSAEEVRGRFILTYRIFSAEVPEALADLSSLVYEREKERAKKFWEDSKLVIEEKLTEEFSGLVNHLVERLHTEPGEKPKIFKDTLLGNFDDWVELFESRNLTKNEALNEQVQKARAVLRTVSPNDLRKNAPLRQEIQQSFAAIKQATDQFIITKPSRLLDLD